MGSPPHARGALVGGLETIVLVGITPACAGSTGRWRKSPVRLRDHPRMRGEHPQAPKLSPLVAGSPPHARGALGIGGRRGRRRGITPACAGSTGRTTTRSGPAPDHPRMRGEHLAGADEEMPRNGSPPHARGAHGPPGPDRHRRGITPACAGSTGLQPRRGGGRRDHPRMRGEHPHGLPVEDQVVGSPPHARGAPVGGQRLHLEVGITPACAGSTSTS